jgi:hypothetical protein
MAQLSISWGFFHSLNVAADRRAAAGRRLRQNEMAVRPSACGDASGRAQG